MSDVWPISWSHSSIAVDGSVGLVGWLLKLSVTPEPAASSKCSSWWFLSSLIIFRACSSLYWHLSVLGFGVPVAPCSPICTWRVLITSKPSVTLVTQPLGPLWPATEFEEWSSETSSFTGSCRHWTLWRKDFWCFFSFGAKENRLIKTNGLREVLAAASHIGFIDWILFSLGFQIFLSYYFSCHILNCFLLYTHCLCLPFGKTFLQSYTSSVQ